MGSRIQYNGNLEASLLRKCCLPAGVIAILKKKIFEILVRGRERSNQNVVRLANQRNPFDGAKGTSTIIRQEHMGGGMKTEHLGEKRNA